MLDIALLPEEYAVCRLPAGSSVPTGLLSGPADSGVLSVTWTADEVSIICRADRVPTEATVETPWRCLRVVGPLDLALTGILVADFFSSEQYSKQLWLLLAMGPALLAIARQGRTEDDAVRPVTSSPAAVVR